MNVCNRLNNYEKRIISFINKEDILTFAKKLIEIPSVNPPGKEYPVAKFIYKILSKAGFEVKMQEVLPGRPNILASLKGKDGKTFVINGHMDVVPAGEGWRSDPFKGIIINDKIIGRGAADMKGGLASILTALIAIKKANIKINGEIIVHAVIDEEVESCGTKSIIKEGIKADYAVIGEPTNLSICIAQKGRLVIKMTANGKAAHASIPDNGVNAILDTIKVLNKMISYGNKLSRRQHPLLGSPTQTITMINGGVKSNIIPEKCEVIIDRRLIPGETIENIKTKLKDAINKFQKNVKKCTLRQKKFFC
ncbi:MAG: M20 family metallopeptidase, partial [Candidatus Bathyarchaeia archaeon]